MELQEAINNPRINVFDVVPNKKSYVVYTFPKPGETKESYDKCHQLNLKIAKGIKK
jgi:hypothetical protein